jgi:ribose-phosphate pyrophosphokinase
MSATLLIALPGNDVIADRLALDLGCARGGINTRHFPDGESYLRLLSDPKGRAVILLCTLDRPDEKVLPLLFAAATARELGASRIGLVAPYLGYMRQDRRFKPGEAVTSGTFARLISSAFDWLVTVDPHLHRYASLSEIYTVPTRVVHAAGLMSDWIRQSMHDPLIIGPDSESEQWVAEVAKDAGAPFTVLEKKRHGDRDVEIKLRDMSGWKGRSAVLVDDIISSGRTMIEAVRILRNHGFDRPACIAVHGLFADRSDEVLAREGAVVITANSVPHPSNRIDVSVLLGRAVRELL